MDGMVQVGMKNEPRIVHEESSANKGGNTSRASRNGPSNNGNSNIPSPEQDYPLPMCVSSTPTPSLPPNRTNAICFDHHSPTDLPSHLTPHSHPWPAASTSASSKMDTPPNYCKEISFQSGNDVSLRSVLTPNPHPPPEVDQSMDIGIREIDEDKQERLDKH